jgi:hypothetical protein
MSQEKTNDQVREDFLRQIWAYIGWWEHDERTPDVHDKLTGLAHSILTIIDGATSLPGFVLAPSPHPEDRQYYKDQDSDWYPETPEVPTDISGALHELFYKIH